MMGSAIITMKELRTDLEKLKPQFAMALPPSFDAGRMVRMCVTAVQSNPALLECTRDSLYGAMVTAAQLGLYPDVSVLGHAYFVPYRDHKRGVRVCTFIAGYKGLIDLARRSGHVTSIMAYPVFEGDQFDWAYGTQPFITHKPSNESKDGRDITHVYALANMRGENRPQFVVMSKEEVDAIRKRSPGRNAGPWVEHYEQMALKTAIRRLCKYLPLSSQLQHAISLDEAADSGIPQNLGSAVDLDAMENEDIVDAEIVDPMDDAKDSLDEALEEMSGSGNEPTEYEKLCIQAMEILGDDVWRTKLAEIKASVKAQSKPPEESKKAMIVAIKKAIKEGR
jgi:recombination protein RecT